MPDFPTNPYKGQIFYDPDSDTIYEYFVPREDDYFCKKLKIKPKWVVPSYESELVNGLFSKICSCNLIKPSINASGLGGHPGT